ncbi:MAG: hypothetical protein PF481_05480 [Bacteroidales bacterium]|jgi:hypothetical protein|nr:hypothetical protein [Bacteroidales bacterium]
MMKKVFILAVIVGLAYYTHAQNTYFTGMGRALFSIDEMTDEVQPEGQQNASSGYTVFDLGINVENEGLMRAGAIIRARNEFGGFYADGSSTLAIRQMQIEGIIGNRVKFGIGDIYLHQTPYTIWNFNESFIDYEADIFSMRRNVVNYENYFIDNNWRVQGVNTETTLHFMQGIKTLGLQAYGARLLESDLLTIPDRLMYGGRVFIVQSDLLKLGGNVVSISDILGTVDSSEVDYDNTVVTGDMIFQLLKKDAITINLIGEGGISSTALREDVSSVDKDKDDFFYEFGVKMQYAPKSKIGLQINYRDVGPDFNSPTAQTRRIIENPQDYSLESFPHFNDASTLRSMTMLDRVSQEYGLYNGSISTGLMDYLPQYNNIEPYGQATPNRRGPSAILSYSDSLEVVSFTMKADMLSEIYSAGDTATRAHRKFIGLKGGVEYNAHKTFDWEKEVILTLGGKYESTTRDGDVPIDLQTVSLDCGLNVETIENLHVLLGAKVLQSQGNEALPVMNRLNEVTTGTTPVTLDLTETLFGFGLQYTFSNTAYFSTQYILNDYENLVPGQEKYTFSTNQWFFTFNISF